MGAAYQPANELPSNRSSVNKNTPHSGTNTAVEFYTVHTCITVPTKKDHRARITATAPVVTYCNAYREDIKLQRLVIFHSSTGINRPFPTSSLTCNNLRICLLLENVHSRELNVLDMLYWQKGSCDATAIDTIATKSTELLAICQSKIKTKELW